MVQPQSVTLLPGGWQQFSQPGATSWVISPRVGEINAQTGLYHAPKFLWLSRALDVIALDNNGQEVGRAALTVSSARNWMGVLGFFWAGLSLLLLIALFVIWPPPAAPPSVAVYPVVATLHQGDTLQFLSSATGTGPDAVLWTVPQGQGQITPAGVFTAPPPPPTAPAGGTPSPIPPITVTATRESDRTQTATAQVLIHDRKLVMNRSVADASALAAREKITFQALGPNGAESGLQWYVSGPGSVDGNGVYTVSDKSAAQAVVTALDPAGGRQAAAVVRLTSGRRVDDKPLLWLVVIMGAFGALLGAMRSFVNFVGSRTFVPSWGFYYFSRPVFGAGLALIVFFAYRIGAVTGPQGASPADPFAAAFIAGIVGLFADTFLQKLQELVTQLFRPADPRTDKMGAAPTPPAITGLAVDQGVLSVTGTNFASGATVLVNGTGLHPTAITPTKITVALPDSLKATGTKLTVVITNADGGKSSAVDVKV